MQITHNWQFTIITSQSSSSQSQFTSSQSQLHSLQVHNSQIRNSQLTTRVHNHNHNSQLITHNLCRFLLSQRNWQVLETNKQIETLCIHGNCKTKNSISKACTNSSYHKENQRLLLSQRKPTQFVIFDISFNIWIHAKVKTKNTYKHNPFVSRAYINSS